MERFIARYAIFRISQRRYQRGEEPGGVMGSVLSALAAVPMLIAPIGAAQSTENDDTTIVGRWAIIEQVSRCVMVSSYDNEVDLIISYDQRLNRATVNFSDLTSQSLKDGDTRTLTIYFSDKVKLDKGWGEAEFIVSAKGERRAFSKNFNGRDMLDDLSRNSFLAFFYNGKMLHSFGLAGSSVAIVKLRECAARQARLNPSDVFADD